MAHPDLAELRHPGPALARVPSPVLVLGAIGSIQFGAALAATLFDELGPAGAVVERLVLASLVLLVVWRPRIRGRTRRELLLAGLFGVILGGMNLCFYEALHRIPLGIAVTIEMVGPLAVAVGGSRRPRDLVWVVLAVAGILALTHGDSGALNTLGVVFALAAGSLWGIYILVNARVGRAFEGGTGLALAMVVASLVTLPFGIAQAGGQLLALHSLAVGAAVAMLSSAIPYTLELEALRRIAPPVFGVLMSLEPAAAALAGFLVLGQQMSARSVVGIALVVVASVGCSLGARRAAVAV
ncbi:MAG: EamA family transporter [Solirubrobacteraceae bacterium]